MIKGVRVVPVKSNVDDRGFLYQIYQSTDGLFGEIKRIYVVGNFDRGVVRGFHKHLEEWKYYFVASGTAKFVFVDETTPEQTTEAVTIGVRNPSVLVVPPNVSHGWVSLEEDTLLVGLSNKTLEESLRDDYREDPYSQGDVWKVKGR